MREVNLWKTYIRRAKERKKSEDCSKTSNAVDSLVNEKGKF